METYTTAGGALIYRIVLNQFPGLMGNTYLVVMNKYHVLIDTGSGYGESNQDLERGLEEISDLQGDDCGFKKLTHIFITHGHIDHYGGLPYIRDRTDAKICIHEMDRRIVSNHRERLFLATHHLEEYLLEAGVLTEHLANLLNMYKITKSMFQSVDVDLTFEAMGMRLGPFSFIHVPGHCAGHVIIRLHDILFSGDHILKETSPHQAPQQITLSTGLNTYLKSLELVRPLVKKVKLTLGGHEDPIKNLNERIDEIRTIHHIRLQHILNLLIEPQTIEDISKTLFGKVQGYTILLALEEAGAHVEYLYQRGFLEIINIKDLEENSKFGPLLYHTVDNKIINI